MALDLNVLNGPQRKIVRDTFVAAFDAHSLNMLLQDKLDKPPLQNIVPTANFEVMVFDLINASKQNGWTEKLIVAAETASENPRIRALRQTLETSASIDIATVDERVKVHSPASGGLERLVRKDGAFSDWGLWVARMTEIGRRICRIEYPVDLKMGGGTGFLVAPDLVLTNYHVIEKHEKKVLDPAQITCRFDFAVGAEAPTPVKLAASWLTDYSRYSPYDPGDVGGLPDVDHLDYALLRLERTVGNDIVDGATRGWIGLRDSAVLPDAKAILFIGQHPSLEPLKLAVGSVIGANGNLTRVRYDANTERGSSGSPCLDAGLNVVALHHGGDPDYSKLLGEFNQGIPIHLILRRLAARGIAKFWF
ncbi:trypsin-like peptidase domain-containing protein [Thauera aminoaromatica]|uniref:Serine protease n=1 Tax=Thauera aminoaromatica TaxID=164330 RepID=A0A5C7SLV2_THASP|nr:trypsin-like peptidase domain-containing protein [Thauera aminoaromatica]TXH84362.1 MAG: serine protease [Thauera aminoaromatica]